nr:hypothetical protein [Tanacetum cinerariifolium]
MENTMFDLVKICHHKQFLCIHDNVDNLIESTLDSKLLLINSQRLDKKEQEVKNIVEQPAGRKNRAEKSLKNFRVIHKNSISFKNTSQISSIHSIAHIQSTREPEHLLSMGYEYLSITLETESDEVTESNAENLLPIPKIPKSDFDFEEEIHLIENLLYDNSFLRPPEELNTEIADTIIEFIPLPIPVHDGNSQQEEIDIVTSSDEVLPPSDDNDDDYDLILEEVDLFLADNSIPLGIENFADDPEGDIRFLEELLIDYSILSHESFHYSFEDSPLIPRPLPEPPDVETNTEEISVMMNDKDEDVYSSFILVIYPEMFPYYSSLRVRTRVLILSEETIFDPGISD